ncbi:MAG: DUF2867 domain-containing protein [Burkholderiales bacterium]|nr:DUF2867 domain-containing protein [Burkholderiales bacterium]
MRVIACDIPLASTLDRHAVEAAWFRDSYRAPLAHPQAGVVQIFFAIFGHHPWWMKLLLLVRNRLASWGGLAAPTAAEIMHPMVKPRYGVGDTIGPWPIFSLTDFELVAGRNNKHLDFRLSVLKEGQGDAASVVVSTICSVHNTFGKVYLWFIIPFHKWGVQRLMARAVAAGRL